MNLKQDCPLCGAPAEYYEVDHFNAKYYSCPACALFSITKTAERTMLGALHPRLAQQARAVTESDDARVLEIRRCSVAGDQEIEATTVLKSDLRASDQHAP